MRDEWVIKVRRWYILDLIKENIHYNARHLHNLPETPEIPKFEEGDDYDQWREDMKERDAITSQKFGYLNQLNKYVRLYEVARRTPDTAPEIAGDGRIWTVSTIDLDKDDIEFFGLSVDEIQEHAIGTGYGSGEFDGY